MNTKTTLMRKSAAQLGYAQLAGRSICLAPPAAPKHTQVDHAARWSHDEALRRAVHATPYNDGTLGGVQLEAHVPACGPRWEQQ